MWPGSECDHSPSFSPKVKNEWSSTSSPAFAFMSFDSYLGCKVYWK